VSHSARHNFSESHLLRSRRWLGNALYKAIELLQILVLTLDPLKDDAADLGIQYRLRIATRQLTTQLEEAVLADFATVYGEPCRAFIAELAGHEEPQP